MTHEEDGLDEEESVPEDQVEGADEGKVVIPQDATVVIEKNDRSVRELFTWHNEHELNLHPDWQRHYVWDKKRVSMTPFLDRAAAEISQSFGSARAYLR
ncbi:MAG: hypothetical protein K2P58_09215 [Hyphomonadaceae bacterium]|nr:hypothetical protein [Hyphomonadaceae bacterium]